MKIKNIFTEIHLVIENIMPIFAAIQYKKEFKMKGSFLHKAAAPPLPPAENVVCGGTNLFCSVKTYLSWILHHQPLTSSFRSNYLLHFHYHNIESAIQKLQLFLFSLY